VLGFIKAPPKKGPPTWECAQSGVALAPQDPVAIGRGEDEKPPAVPGAAPHGVPLGRPGVRMVLRGLPQPWPTAPAPGATAAGRLREAGTTSSSSAANADEPSTPLGLGDRLLGDTAPEPEAGLASTVPVGLAIGAMGRVIGPGPEMAGSAAADMRRLAPGGPGGWIIGDPEGETIWLLTSPIFGGMPMGAVGTSPTRGNPGSYVGPFVNDRGMGEGARAGGGGICWSPCCA